MRFLGLPNDSVLTLDALEMGRKWRGHFYHGGDLNLLIFRLTFEHSNHLARDGTRTSKGKERKRGQGHEKGDQI